MNNKLQFFTDLVYTPESISAGDKKVAESAGGDAGELNELEDELCRPDGCRG